MPGREVGIAVSTGSHSQFVPRDGIEGSDSRQNLRHLKRVIGVHLGQG